MLRVCLDTNVLLSGITHSGTPSEIINLVFQKKIRLVTSTFILAELAKNLTGKFGVSPRQVRKLTDRISGLADVYEPKGTVNIVRECLPDNLILETAWVGRAKYLVTGDKRHLTPLKIFRNIKILEPAEFVAIVRQ